MSHAAAEGLTCLQVECLSKLEPVRFGLYSSAERIASDVRMAHAARRAVSERQVLALYKICWRYRAQIADWKFTARVLIAQALLEEHLDLADLVGNKVYARAWRARPAQGELKIVRP